MKIHIVQKGDTLWEIAKKYGVNFEELKMLNSQLSNPDMIMPGMKIKVPTTGGSIKKEAPIIGTKKEMPIKEHPYVKEKPIAMPIKEAPKKEMPIKEKPIKELPKEKPYTPKMPTPIIPEIDINNYYTMSMTNLDVDVDIDIEEKMPEPVKPEPPKMHIEAPVQDVCPPIIPYQPYCYEVSPMMPGSGFPPGVCPPSPLEQMPMQYEQTPMPGVMHGEYTKWEEESSSSSHMHHYGKVAGGYQPSAVQSKTGYPEMGNIPAEYYQQPLVTYGQMPTEHGYNQKHSYQQESSSNSIGHHIHHTPMPYSPAQADDCGCGGPAIPQPGIYGEQGFSPQMGAYPFPEVQAPQMGVPQEAGYPQIGAYPYPEMQAPQMGAYPYPEMQTPQMGVPQEAGYPQMGAYPYPGVQAPQMGMPQEAGYPQMGAYPYPGVQAPQMGGYPFPENRQGIPQGFVPAPFPPSPMPLDPRMMGAPYPPGVVGNIPTPIMEDEVHVQNVLQQESFAPHNQQPFAPEMSSPIFGPGGNAPVYAPPFNGNFAQPPLMNPYGAGAATPFGMPRYFDDESSDYGN
ncbi:SafA/ExsA family spore coat assembly protein [Niallia sp. NCCP-28]|uniref:SafA/ExsA family spore coat assembly protein n=1 Tax=Niallia sp. NCCP-28 TaxID=2934712 RepID=UPI00208B1A0B|nr:SafA/ExsA family spore coat assembly protein [Niallia sp. NCCP-28]GKU81419.1 hypothetical protein NCCP28_08150 [Niallia sp. NCCP-28]